MTEEEALLAAVCAKPDDDLPRLVYADWLEENAGGVPCRECGGRKVVAPNGHGTNPPRLCPECAGTGRVSDGRAERAEFIRVQCELRRHPARLLNPDASYGEYADLCRRERELWNDPRPNAAPRPWVPVPHGFRWTADWLINHDRPRISTTRLGSAVEFELKCGFPSEVTCTVAGWVGLTERVAHTAYGEDTLDYIRRPGIGPAVVAAHPIREVRLADAVVRTEGGRWAVLRGDVGPLWDFCDALPGQAVITSDDREALQHLVNGMALLWARREAGILSPAPSVS